MSKDRWVTGRQLTVMVVAICVAVVGAPAAVMASTASLTSIVDPVHPHEAAHVDKAGHLYVASAGQPIQVAGSVATSSAGNPYVATNYSPNTLTLPAKERLTIDQLSIFTTSTSSSGVYSEFIFREGGKSAELFIPLTYADTENGVSDYESNQQVTLHPDPGSTMWVNVYSAGSVGETILTVAGTILPT